MREEQRNTFRSDKAIKGSFVRKSFYFWVYFASTAIIHSCETCRCPWPEDTDSDV